MIFRPLPSHRQAIITCALTALTALMCAGLLGAAALVPAPPLMLPVIVTMCVVVPMLAAWQSVPSLAVLRSRRPSSRLDERALNELRRDLDRLPETGHPLGL